MSELGSRAYLILRSVVDLVDSHQQKDELYVDRNDDALSGLKRGGGWPSTRGYNLYLETAICTTCVLLYTVAMCVCPANLGAITWL